MEKDKENNDSSPLNYNSFMMTLVDIWRNEKLCQDLLPFEEKIITDAIAAVEQKEKELSNDTTIDKTIKYYTELDIQRIKYVIKDYLRIRLMKIEKYLFYLLKNNVTDILSQNEMNFAAGLMDAKALYFNQALKKMSSLSNIFYPFTDKTKTLLEKMEYITQAFIDSPPKNDFVVVENIKKNSIILNLKEAFEDYKYGFMTLESGEKCLLPFSVIKQDLDAKKLKII